MSRVTERHLDLPSTTARPSIDQADAVGAVLGQPVLRVAHEQHFGQDHEADPAEITAVVGALKSAVSIIELRIEHLLDVHDRNAPASSVLEELGVVHGAVMIDYVGGAAVVAEHDVRGITDRRPVEAISLDLGSAHDGVWRLVVPRSPRCLEVYRVDPPGPT